MRCAVALLIFVLAPSIVMTAHALPDPDWRAHLAARFSSPEAADLSAETIRGYFVPLLDIEQFSRGRCTPILKATGKSSLPVSDSFIGTTIHRSCGHAGRVVVVRVQFKSSTATATDDFQGVRAALLTDNGTPCFDGTQDGADVTYWSDQKRVLSIEDKIDNGPGFTISLFSRSAVSPPTEDGDAEVYDFWNKSMPTSCQSPHL